MQRYFLDHKELNISGDMAHHIKNVMRMKKGDLIEVCFPNECFIAKIVNMEENIEFELQEQVQIQLKNYCVTLFQGLPKGDKVEFVIKYATEFGVDEIVFVPMQRSIAKMDALQFDKRLERYQKIALESARLAHRHDVPKITYLSDLGKIDNHFDLGLIAYEETRNITLKKLLENIKSIPNIGFIIGPEGGISPQEIKLLKDKQFLAVGLGNRILQTEIAALYALTAIDALLM